MQQEKLAFLCQAARKRLINFCELINPKWETYWFHEYIANILQESIEKIKRNEKVRIILTVPPRHGKEILSSELVLTPNGFKKHGDLIKGDFVFHPSGRKIKVLNNIPQPEPATLKVTLTDGSSVVVHPNHEWTVTDRKKTTSGKMFTYETREMIGNEWMGVKGKRGSRARFQLPHNSVVNFPERKTIVDPYTFGYWIGNGTTDDNKQITFNPATYEEVLEHIPYKPTSTYWHNITGVPRMRFDDLPRVKFDKKYIPDEYIFNSEEKRREFLAGLIDSDGFIDKKTGRVVFTNTNKNVIDSVNILLRTLGYYPNTQEVEPAISTSGIVGKKKVYTLDFVVLDGKKVSKIKQKNIPRLPKIRRRAIAQIEEVKGGVGNCIEVDSKDGLYLVTENLIPTHNSQLSSIYFPAWALGKYPDIKFILSTYGAELSEKMGLQTRDVIDSEFYQTIFPGVKLRQDQRAKAKWMTNKGGSYLAVANGSAVTGSGANCIIIDDPHKSRDEAESETVRNFVWEYYRSTLYSRLEGVGAVIVIMQRWHCDDMIGRLLEEQEKVKAEGTGVGDEWTVINFPAIAEEDEYIEGKLVRKSGEALWPSKFPISVLENIKRTSGIYNFIGQYQQTPISAETQEFKESYFKYYKPDDIKDKYLRYYTFVDPAIGQKKTSDNTVVLTVAKEVNGPNIYRIREDAGHFDPAQTINLIFSHQAEYKSDVYVETIAYQQALKFWIIEEQRKKQIYFTVNEIKSHTQKEIRIRGLLPLYQAGVIHHQVSDIEYERELLSFPSGKRDDRCDAQSFFLLAGENTRGMFAKQVRSNFRGYFNRKG